MRFAPDGRSLAVQSANAVTVYRLDTLEVIARIVNAAGIAQVEYTPDSQSLAVRSGSQVRVWRLSLDNSPVRSLGPNALAQGTAFSGDGRYVATADAADTVRVWETETGRPVSRPLHTAKDTGFSPRRPETMGFTPDGTCLLVAGGDWRVHCWDWRAGRERWTTPPCVRDIRALAISPDGQRVAAAAGLYAEYCLVQQRDVRTGRLLNQFTEPDIANAMAYSPDSARLLMVNRTRPLRHGCAAMLRAAATGAPIGHPLHHDQEILNFAWSHDGRRVVTCSADGIAQVWDGHSGAPLGPPLHHAGAVNVVAFSPDDRLIATYCLAGTAQIWNAATGVRIGEPMVCNNPTGDPGIVGQMVFSPNGQLLFTGWTASTKFNGAVRVWEATSGRPAGYALPRLTGQCSISISPDGRWLLGSTNRQTWEIGSSHPHDSQAVLWHLPQIPHLSPSEIEQRTEARLGLRRNRQGVVEALPPVQWRRLRTGLPSLPDAPSF